MQYVALIWSRYEFGRKTFSLSEMGEDFDHFKQRILKAWGLSSEWNIDFYELGKALD